MRAFFYVLYALTSTGALVSLFIYIGLLYRGDSRILYGTSHVHLGSRKANIFLLLAAFALMVCLYQGTRALLMWMPSNWGGVDEDHEWVRASTTLALLGPMAGVFFIAAIDR